MAKAVWYNHTAEYYSATKRNEVWIHATSQKNFEYFLHERSQTQKATYYMIPFI